MTVDSGKLARAYLTLSQPSTSGGKKGGGPSERIEFSFNPKELTIARSAEWRAKPSKKAAMPEFVGTKPASMTIEMFLDASESGDVSGSVDKLMTCVDPHPKTESDKPSPPFVAFGWGTTTYLDHAVIKSVSVKFTRFRPDGAPIRAVATVTIEELKPASEQQNPTSGTREIHAEHMMSGADTLASVAYEHYGSPNAWRSIAEINGIDDPFRVRAGTRLAIPKPTASSHLLDTGTAN